MLIFKEIEIKVFFFDYCIWKELILFLFMWILMEVKEKIKISKNVVVFIRINKIVLYFVDVYGFGKISGIGYSVMF